ncbi:hypothetical protein Btru_035734 [Bulinus truncatus]|nr:hypothetical protein Btru_035734 [Bulinus truncatus]
MGQEVNNILTVNYCYGVFFTLVVFSSLPLPSHAGEYCNDGTYCVGIDEYCCGSGSGYYSCCTTSIYNIWWFWLIFVFVLLLAFSCGIFCWHKRRTRIRYTVMANSQYPTYGTVIHTSNTTATSAYNPPAGAVPPYGTNYTQVPPPAYYSQQQSPPPYPTSGFSSKDIRVPYFHYWTPHSLFHSVDYIFLVTGKDTCTF